MKQVELRLALVFYGGVSLAVHMHGVTREILNLTRASHRRERGGTSDALSPAAQAYGALLDHIGEVADIKVVPDIIAGASAGGVNGIMLARALAHDLPLEPHHDLWMRNADITRLINPSAGPTRYLKRVLAPLLGWLAFRNFKGGAPDPETRRKLQEFVQARWFTPPFSGEKFIKWMLDACGRMRVEQKSLTSQRNDQTLIPSGQKLDLFVTLTDYHGRRRLFQIETPSVVCEMQHCQIIHFEALRRGDGELVSQLDDAGIPDLVFAARATASFPGAFPPAGLAEMDAVLAARGEKWLRRSSFIRNGLHITEEEASKRLYIDGSVVMNKPFAPVIEAISNRAAVREVIRRLVYVEPQGQTQERAEKLDEPVGFFKVILSSLTQISRNEPIGDALEAVEEKNAEVRLVNEVIAAARPEIERQVERILPLNQKRSIFASGFGEEELSVDALTRARAMAHEAAYAQAGFAYPGYQKLKLRDVTRKLARLILQISRVKDENVSISNVSDHLSRWLQEGEEGESLQGLSSPRSVWFLQAFDIEYRIRWLRFVIRRLNELYRNPGHMDDAEVLGLNELKSLLYAQIDHLSERWSLGFYGDETKLLVQSFLQGAGEGDARAITRVLDNFERLMGLRDIDRHIDDVFVATGMKQLSLKTRCELLKAYIGFAFYDIVALPILHRADSAEINEIRVNRISPSDAQTLRPGGVRLKGAALNSFGAFFNRKWREHDYLWGRITAADRLFDMVMNAGRELGKENGVDYVQLRANLFNAILDEEETLLTADPHLISQCRMDVGAWLASQRDDAETSHNWN